MKKKTQKRKLLWKFLFALGIVYGLFCQWTCAVLAAEPEEGWKLERVVQEEVITGTLGDFSGEYFTDGSYVSLKVGNYEKWIDRIQLSGELTHFDLKGFYNKLVEGSDGDGVEDILIDDSYFDGEHAIEAVIIRRPYVEGMNLDSIMDREYERYRPAIMAAYCAFDRDHPEVFWLSGNWQSIITADISGNEYEITISFLLQDNIQEESFDIRAHNYRLAEKIRDAIALREERISKYLKEAEGKTDYQKVVSFYSGLVKTNSYNSNPDFTSPDNSSLTCISALVGNTKDRGPVCEGYARALKVLCDRAGIGCVLVDGLARNASTSPGEAHMWNYVRLYGKWYGVDATFGDPIDEDLRPVSGYENGDYLLVGGETVIEGMKFKESHPVSNSVAEEVISFTNGPILAKNSYPRRIVGDKKEIILGIPPKGGYTHDPAEKAEEQKPSAIRNKVMEVVEGERFRLVAEGGGKKEEILTYSVNREGILVIDKEGNVHAKRAGVVKVLVTTLRGEKLSITVKVKEKEDS